MACGCGDSSCNCVVVAGDNASVTGSGTPSNPYTVSTPSETPWTGSNSDGGIIITPGGAAGHAPVINLNHGPPVFEGNASGSASGATSGALTVSPPLFGAGLTYTNATNSPRLLYAILQGTIRIVPNATVGTALDVNLLSRLTATRDPSGALVGITRLWSNRYNQLIAVTGPSIIMVHRAATPFATLIQPGDSVTFNAESEITQGVGAASYDTTHTLNLWSV